MTDSERAAPAATAAGTASGEVLLDTAISKLQKHASFSARVRLQVKLHGHRLYGSGRYLQQGRADARRLRLDLSIQGTNYKHQLSHVRDGQTLWLFENLADQPKLQLVDLSKVADDDFGRSGPLLPAVNGMAVGGLPQLLSSLQRNFQFGQAERHEWNGLQTWIVRGVWRRERLTASWSAAATSKKTAERDAPVKLPERVPRGVILVVDGETLAPYRVEYLGTKRKGSNAGADSLMVMELIEVQLNQAIDAGEFRRPSRLAATDITEAYLKRLGVVSPADEESKQTGTRTKRR